jgi:hypothetical protein
MADEPEGTGATGGAPPEAAAAPPPLAAAPPPLAAPPPAPVAPVARPGLSPAAIVAMVVALILAVLAILYFGGVFERLASQRAEPASVEQPAPAAPAAAGGPTAGEAGGDLAYAPEGAPPRSFCRGVYSEQEAREAPERGMQQSNRLTVTAAGAILWNDTPIDAVRLRQYLDIVMQMSPRPRTVVRMDPGAPAAQIEAVSGAISGAMNCEYRPS